MLILEESLEKEEIDFDNIKLFLILFIMPDFS